MADALETLTRGYSVEPGRIEQELSRFWEGGEDVATRASLMNLAFYVDDPADEQSVSELVGQLTREHACRAIVVVGNAASDRNRVRAWINAHCHITRAGAKQVCCEQITFHLEGSALNALANIVFSHLDSDLPLYLWWRGSFDETLCPKLWSWVDRLIYDSAAWDDAPRQLDTIRRTIVERGMRMALCDLNWTRIVYFRQGLAHIFDHPEAAALALHIAEVRIDHDPKMRSTANLLAGWLAAQSGWSLVEQKGQSATYKRPSGEETVVRFNGKDGAAIGGLALSAPGLEIELQRSAQSRYLHASLTLGSQCEIVQMLPAGGETLAEIANEELVRGGQHKLYLRASGLL